MVCTEHQLERERERLRRSGEEHVVLSDGNDGELLPSPGFGVVVVQVSGSRVVQYTNSFAFRLAEADAKKQSQ